LSHIHSPCTVQVVRTSRYCMTACPTEKKFTCKSSINNIVNPFECVKTACARSFCPNRRWNARVAHDSNRQHPIQTSTGTTTQQRSVETERTLVTHSITYLKQVTRYLRKIWWMCSPRAKRCMESGVLTFGAVGYLRRLSIQVDC
jgi:hypothetical protein